VDNAPINLNLSQPRRSQIRRLADYLDSLEGSAVPLYAEDKYVTDSLGRIIITHRAGMVRDEFLEQVRQELFVKGCEGVMVSRSMGHNLHITFSLRLVTG